MFREAEQVDLREETELQKKGYPRVGLYKGTHEEKNRDVHKPDLRPDAQAYKYRNGRRLHHQTNPVRNGILI